MLAIRKLWASWQIFHQNFCDKFLNILKNVKMSSSRLTTELVDLVQEHHFYNDVGEDMH